MSNDRSEGPLSPAFAGELLGAAISIDAHPGLARLPLQGTLVDESLETFLVRRSDEIIVRVPKLGARGTIVLDGRPLPLNGDFLRVRPEDRTKRLLGRGRRGQR